MRSVKVDNDKISVISDFVSKVVHSHEDDIKFEGAYINCGVNDNQELKSVNLYLVYIDYRFTAGNFIDEMEDISKSIGVDLKITQEPYWMYGGSSKYLNKCALMTGNIIYDRNGNLTEKKRLAQLEGVGIELGEGIVIEPPIQYKKVS